jgi:hypothetical protein
MSSVGSVGAGSQVFALISNLQDVVAAGQQKQVDLATKLIKVDLSNAIETQSQATVGSLLNKVL